MIATKYYVLSGLVIVGLIAGAATSLHALRSRAQEYPPETMSAPLTGGKAVVADIENSPDASGLPDLFEAPKFVLKTQDGKTITNTDLEGHPYVAAFIFTNCTSVCPMISGRMSGLQERIHAREVRLVSFTVDPERDTPEAMKAYAAKFQADTTRWFFLTGTKAQMVAVETGFNVRLPKRDPNATVGDPKDPMSLMPHSDRFILVDGQGRVRGIYDSKEETEMNKLKYDSERLAELVR